jgi:hypothetical protein
LLNVQPTAFKDEIVCQDLQIEFLFDGFGLCSLDSRAGFGDIEHGCRQALAATLSNSRCPKCGSPAEMAPVLRFFYHKMAHFPSYELGEDGRSGLRRAGDGRRKFAAIANLGLPEWRRDARLSQL